MTMLTLGCSSPEFWSRRNSPLQEAFPPEPFINGSSGEIPTTPRRRHGTKLHLFIGRGEDQTLPISGYDSGRSTDSLEGELSQTQYQLFHTQHKLKETSQECHRLECELAAQNCQLEALGKITSENERLQRALTQALEESQLREADFEREQLKWEEEQKRSKKRIQSLMESLKAKHEVPDVTHDEPCSEEVSQPPAIQEAGLLANIPPEVARELEDLRQLVPSYMDTVSEMETTLSALNEELEELSQAYQELYESQQAAEVNNQPEQDFHQSADPQPCQTTLAEELSRACHCVSEKANLSEQAVSRMLAVDEQQRGEIVRLRETNEQLELYLNRLLNRIIGLEEFEKILNRDFDLNCSTQATPTSASPLSTLDHSQFLGCFRLTSAKLTTRALELIRKLRRGLSERMKRSHLPTGSRPMFCQTVRGPSYASSVRFTTYSRRILRPVRPDTQPQYLNPRWGVCQERLE